MKKMLFLLCAMFVALQAFAVQYYVSGNGTTGNPWCNGLSWGAKACPMTMSGNSGSITFEGVPAGAYQFKVTNGTTWYGANKFRPSCSNLYAYGNDNICFSTTQTQDITVSYDGTYICLTGTVGNDYSDTTQYGAVGVPTEYEGVMMQCFYWNSYQDQGYGRTKWIDLIKIADEIGDNFDLVWFPPSAEGGGTGYYAKRYSIQDSDWGTREKLRELIGKLHAKCTKVIGDIVVNHHASSNSWCAFYNENFGSYGQFQLTSEHICSGDECFSDKDSNCKGSTERGAADTGDNDAGCRDLDHTSEFVQNLVKAYLSWMRNSIGYDGWRYDMVKGYLGGYVSMYNISSQPYFSVGEYWDGTPNNLKNYLETTSYNTTVFDFPLKYKFNSNIGKGSYAGMKNAGLRSIGLQKYAVTFIDNHDTFERSDNQSDEFIGYKKNLVTNKAKVLQANAYLLMMPGTPCVFFPHWVTFKSEINTLIALRKAAGIHSESQVFDEVGESKAYAGTIQGHNGSVILRMGPNRDTSVPAGYFLAVQGNDFEIYASNEVVFTPVNITSVENVREQTKSEKQLINGHLYIIKNGNKYDATGRLIQ
ncbi:MAG: alpha-amylase [Paludibacteraceae bacterium]|nr:alpha-amylase [Paludibacteraceae bacterium]